MVERHQGGKRGSVKTGKKRRGFPKKTALWQFGEVNMKSKKFHGQLQEKWALLFEGIKPF